MENIKNKSGFIASFIAALFMVTSCTNNKQEEVASLGKVKDNEVLQLANKYGLDVEITPQTTKNARVDAEGKAKGPTKKVIRSKEEMEVVFKELSKMKKRGEELDANAKALLAELNKETEDKKKEVILEKYRIRQEQIEKKYGEINL